MADNPFLVYPDNWNQPSVNSDTTLKAPTLPIYGGKPVSEDDANKALEKIQHDWGQQFSPGMQKDLINTIMSGKKVQLDLSPVGRDNVISRPQRATPRGNPFLVYPDDDSNDSSTDPQFLQTLQNHSQVDTTPLASTGPVLPAKGGGIIGGIKEGLDYGADQIGGLVNAAGSGLSNLTAIPSTLKDMYDRQQAASDAAAINASGKEATVFGLPIVPRWAHGGKPFVTPTTQVEALKQQMAGSIASISERDKQTQDFIDHLNSFLPGKSQAEQNVDAITQDPRSSISDVALAYATNPSALVDKAAGAIAEYAPAMIPGVGPALGAAEMSLGSQRDALQNYAAQHGVDPKDTEALSSFYKDPDNVIKAQRNAGIHEVASGTLGLVIPQASKAIDAAVPSYLSATQKTIAKIAANVSVQPTIAIAAQQGAAMAAGEKPQSAGQMADTAIQTIGLFAPSLLSGTVHDFAVDRAKVDTTTGNALNEYLDQAGAAKKADTNTILDIKLELDKQRRAQEQKEDLASGWKKADQDVAGQAELRSAQEEADQRNQVLVNQYADQTRLETYPDGSMERVPVNPPAGITAEDVLAEREQARKDEADRVQRVALGQLAESVRARDALTTQQKQEAQAKQESWLKTAQTKQTNGIIDNLRQENPNATPDELAPIVQEALKNAPPLIPPSNDPIIKQITNIVRGKQVADRDKATRAQRKVIGQIVKDNPGASLRELADLYNKSQEDNGQTPPPPITSSKAIPTQEAVPQPALSSATTGSSSTPSEPTIQDMTSLDMAKGSNKQKTKQAFPDTLHNLVKGLISHGGRTANDILNLANQRKLVVAPNAESIGRQDTGAASYDPKTGQLYLYTDHTDPKGVVGSIIQAIHESTHGGQYNSREGRNDIMSSILGVDGNSQAKTRVEQAAKGGNKLAKAAVQKAKEAAGDNQQIYDLELMPYFAGEVAKQRGGTFGRLGGVVKDILAGSRNMLREKGFDIQPSLNDIASATQRTAGELTKTKITPRFTDSPVNMMIGEKATDAAERKAAGRGAIGEDGKWRDEIADNKADLNISNLGKTVSQNQDLINIMPNHYELYKTYPASKNIQVGVDHSLRVEETPAYQVGNHIYLAPGTLRNSEFARNKILHEVQHWVQDKEGFSPGGSSEQFINPRYAERVTGARNAMSSFVTPYKLGAALDSLPDSAREAFENSVKDLRQKLPLDEIKKVFFDEAANKSKNIDVRNAARKYDRLRQDLVSSASERDKHHQEAYNKYFNLPGEVEARQTEARSRMTPEELAVNPVSSAKNELPTESLNMAKEVEPNDEEPINSNAATKEAYQRVTGLRGAVSSLFGTNTTREIGRQMQAGWLAKHDKDYTTAERQVAQYKKYFDKMPEGKRLQIIDDWQTGKSITDPNAKAFFDAITPLYKEAIDYIRSVDPSLLKDLNERYLAQIWKRGWNNGTRDFLTKGPLAGSKAFLKARQWKTIKEGMEKGGLTPLTTNPAELTMIKLGELLKFSGFIKFREDLKDRGWLVKNKLGKEPPEGWSTVNDPSFMGYIVPDVIAHDLNKNLSRGLTDVPGFRQIRELENMMVMGKLGWSGFHAAFTTFDNLSTGFETALRGAAGGDLKGAIVGALKAAGSPVLSPYEGGALIKTYLGQEPKSASQAARWQWLAGIDQHTKALMDLIEKGGGRAFMDKSEWNNAISKMKQSILQKNAKHFLNPYNALKSWGEISSYPIHRMLVPAQKMSARVLLLKAELDRLADKYDLGTEKGDYTGIINALHPDAAAQVARKVVNLVDDRLGHMSYDNQFWNPYLRHMAQLINIAPGWFTGTLRTIAGGLTDTRRLLPTTHIGDTQITGPEKIMGSLDKAGKINDATFGGLTSRTSNLIMLSMLTAAMSGAFMYSMTGQWPQTFKDYIHPKTGRKNPDGTDERIAWPTYAKEHYALLTDPVHEIARKANHPLLQSVYELFNNADYTNTEIYRSHGTTPQKVEDITKYLAKGFFEPISASNAQRSDTMAAVNPKNSELNEGMKVAGLFGVTPARQEIDHTDLQNYINKKYFATFPQAPLSRDQKDRFTARNKAITDIRAGNSVDLSDFTTKERQNIRQIARGDVDTVTFINRFKALPTLEDKIEAWNMATDQEKEEYKMRATILHNAREQVAKIYDKQHRQEVAGQIQKIRQGQ